MPRKQKNITTDHQRERNRNRFVGFDNPENGKANQLDGSVHVNALERHFPQVIEIRLVFGGHEHDS